MGYALTLYELFWIEEVAKEAIIERRKNRIRWAGDQTGPLFERVERKMLPEVRSRYRCPSKGKNGQKYQRQTWTHFKIFSSPLAVSQNLSPNLWVKIYLRLKAEREEVRLPAIFTNRLTFLKPNMPLKAHVSVKQTAKPCSLRIIGTVRKYIPLHCTAFQPKYLLKLGRARRPKRTVLKGRGHSNCSVNCGPVRESISSTSSLIYGFVNGTDYLWK